MVRDYDESKIPAVYNLQDVPAARNDTGSTQKIFRGLDSMVGFTKIKSDEEAEPHSHPFEQINLLIKGKVDFYVGGEIVTLERYDILEIPPGVEHESRELSDGPAELLAFWPLREDRLEHTAYQTEFPDKK